MAKCWLTIGIKNILICYIADFLFKISSLCYNIKGDNMNKKKLLTFMIVLITLLFLEQYIKYFVVNNNYFINIINNILSINFEKNYGIAFSLFENNNLITIIVSCILIIYLMYVLCNEFVKNKKYTNFMNITFSILFAGIISNLIDRIIRGFVVDYIDLSFFAVFNLADIFITYGVFVLLIKFIKE